MAKPRFILHDVFAEKKTAKITATLKDEDGSVLALVSVDTLTPTLYEEVTGTIINSRSRSNIKNTGGGTLHATSGAFTLTFAPADMAFIQTDPTREWHIATISSTSNSGAVDGCHELAYQCEHLAEVR